MNCRIIRKSCKELANNKNDKVNAIRAVLS